MKRTRFASGAAIAIVIALVACKKDAPPPDVVHPVILIGGEPASSDAPPPADPPAAPPTPPPPPPPPPPAPAPELIACKTDDDCWFDDAKKPAARPKNLRGKRVIPCKTGGHVPSCSDQVCIVRSYKC